MTMKFFAMLLTVCFLTLCGAASSFGLQVTTTFSDEYNFSGSEKSEDDRDYLEIGYNSRPFNFIFYHNVTFNPAADEIESAQIVLTHQGNSANPGEAWILYGNSATKIGDLINSTTANQWVDQVFPLPSSLYSAVTGGTWALALQLTEDTTGTDNILLDKSVLSGFYNYTQQDNGGGGLTGEDVAGAPPQSTQVPEPGTIALVGLGLAAIGLYRRGHRD